MTHSPILKAWELYFNEGDGLDNRSEVVKDFADFWEKTEAKELKLPGKCMLGGKVYGRKGFNDGDEVFTSYIVSIERLEHGDNFGVPHDTMCATTISGSKYYLYSDEHNAHMALMLGDMIHTGGLNPRRYHYISKKFHGSNLL